MENMCGGYTVAPHYSYILFWSSSFFLFVPTEDLLPAGFPNIDMGPQLKVVERTRTANMLCAASGNPDPEITWFKDFLPIDPSTSNGRIKQLRSGKTVTFHFPAGFLEHAYFCTKTFVAGFKLNPPCKLYKAQRQLLN